MGLGRVPGGLRRLGGVLLECQHGSLTGVPGALTAVGVLHGMTAVVRLAPARPAPAGPLGGPLDHVQLSRGQGVQQGPEGRHLGRESGTPHQVDVGAFDARRGVRLEDGVERCRRSDAGELGEVVGRVADPAPPVWDRRRPSAYDAATIRNRMPTARITHDVRPSACEGDDAEREVDRRRDLAVGDGGERRDVEDALEPCDLRGHAGLWHKVEARAPTRSSPTP